MASGDTPAVLAAGERCVEGKDHSIGMRSRGCVHSGVVQLNLTSPAISVATSQR
jgi:hypothetical protein